METTLVTMIFDLQTLESTPSRRPINFYKNQGLSLLRSSLPLVIFTHTVLIEWLSQHCQELGRTAITQIIVVDPEFIHPRVPRIRYIIDQIPGATTCEKPQTALFTALTWAKISFLERVAVTNPFSSQAFCWIDFGLSYVVPYSRDRSLQDIMTVLIDPRWRGKIHITVPEPIRWISVENEPSNYWSKFTSSIAAGLFGGDAEAITTLSNHFWRQADVVLEQGFVPLEQNILSYIYHQQSTLFQPWFGRYDDIGINWGGLRVYSDDLPLIVNLCRWYGCETNNHTDCNLRSGVELAQQLLEGADQQVLSLTPKIKARLLTELFLCRWYGSPPNDRISLATAVGEDIIHRYKEDLELAREIELVRDMVNVNLGFVSLTLPDPPESK